jgi:hypothetical protein
MHGQRKSNRSQKRPMIFERCFDQSVLRDHGALGFAV